MRGELSVNSPDVWEENYQITHQMYERRIIKLTRCMRRELSFDSPDIWEENYQIRNYSFFPGCNWALEIPGFIIINNPGVYIFLKITQIFSSNYAWVLELYILNYLYDFVRKKRFKIGKVKISAPSGFKRIQGLEGFGQDFILFARTVSIIKSYCREGHEGRNYHVKTFFLIDKDNSLIVCHR